MIGFIKQDFVKKGGLTKTFLIKRGVGGKRGGYERFRILRGDLAKKRVVTFLGGGHTLVPTMRMFFRIFRLCNNAFMGGFNQSGKTMLLFRKPLNHH